MGLVILETLLEKRLHALHDWKEPPCRNFKLVETMIKTVKLKDTQMGVLLEKILVLKPEKRMNISQMVKDLTEIVPLEKALL